MGAVVVIFISALTIKIVRQYDRIVIFRFGKLLGENFAMILFADRTAKVDMRVRELDVPKQTIVSRNNVSLDANAVVYYKVSNSCKAIVEMEDYEAATALLAQTTLRDGLDQNELDTILSERGGLNKEIQEILYACKRPLGNESYYSHHQRRGVTWDHAQSHCKAGRSGSNWRHWRNRWID